MAAAGCPRSSATRRLHVAFLASMVAAVAAQQQQRLREALLCEAQRRLEVLTSSPDLLYGPHERDGVVVQQTKADHRCDAAGGSGEAPITVGRFDVEGVSPVDVFNAFADARMSWDSTASSVKHLGDFQDEGARGMYMVYPTGVPFVPSRSVAEWLAFNASMERNEFMVAFTTEQDEKLESMVGGGGGYVRAQNCLGAYHVRPTATGAHVEFTQHVNGHAPVLPASLIASVTWGQQVDYINKLRARAKALAKQGQSAQQVSLPPWMLEDQGSHMCDSEPQLTTVQLFGASPSVSSVDVSPAGRSFLRLAVLGMVLSFASVLGWQRLRRPRATPLFRTAVSKTAAAEQEQSEQQEQLLSV